MAKTTTLTPQYVVSAALSEEQFAELAQSGFKSVVNFRPDGEAASQIDSGAARQAAVAAGLAYAHIPVRKHDLFSDETVSEAERTLAKLPSPILAYCASGQRAAVLWAAVSARSQPATQVLQTLKSAGFDLEFLRDDLEAQADRARWSQTTGTTGAPDESLVADRKEPASAQEKSDVPRAERVAA